MGRTEAKPTIEAPVQATKEMSPPTNPPLSVCAHTGPAPRGAKFWVNGSPILVTVWKLSEWRKLPYECRPAQACWSWDGRVILAIEGVLREGEIPDRQADEDEAPEAEGGAR